MATTRTKKERRTAVKRRKARAELVPAAYPSESIISYVNGAMLLHFDRLPPHAFVGGEYPRIAKCSCCGRTGALTKERFKNEDDIASIRRRLDVHGALHDQTVYVCWHYAQIVLDFSNEPRMSYGDCCVWTKPSPHLPDEHSHPAYTIGHCAKHACPVDHSSCTCHG